MADMSSGLGAALAGLVRNGGIALGAEARPAAGDGRAVVGRQGRIALGAEAPLTASRREVFGQALPPLGLTTSGGVRTQCCPPGAEAARVGWLDASLEGLAAPSAEESVERSTVARLDASVERSTVSRLAASIERIDPLLGRLFAGLWEAGDPRLVLTAGALSLASLRCSALDPQDFRLLRATALQGLIVWLEDEAGRDGSPPWEAAILASDCVLAEWMTEIALLDGALPERLARSWARQRAARLEHDPGRRGTGEAVATGGARAAKRRHEFDLEAPGWEIAEFILGSGAVAGRAVSSAEIVRTGAWLGMLARLAVTARLGGRAS